MSYESQYSSAVVDSMESAYGEGFLSPGGAEEVGDMLSGLALGGQTVLDLGCGIGGASVLLARDFGAARVIGIDVEAESIARATDAAKALELDDRVSFQHVEPGPLPLPDGHFDLVFTKDVVCHLSDKVPLLAEVCRVLRPGGRLVLGDWMKGDDRAGAEAFEAWVAQHRGAGLKFSFEPEVVYRTALDAAGFIDVTLREHSEWSADKARREIAHNRGPGRDALVQKMGEAAVDVRIHLTETRLRAIESGGLRHCHLRARKPG